MQKARKQRTDQANSLLEFHKPQRYKLPFPEVVNVDVLATALDEDLANRLRVLEDERNRVIESHTDARPWEEEIAYVRREQQLRRVRRDHHQDFVRREQEAFDRYEAQLPAGDFDNSAFVYAATGGRPRWS